MSTLLTNPDQLCEALGIPFSAEQLAAATASLEPGVIIAGAGSGKTTVMAARVVWLVGTGAVRADQVLGLTFTRKAAGELSQRVRAALTRSGVVSEQAVHDLQGQSVLTYDSFAGQLVAENAPRIGDDPVERLLSEPMRYRLAGQVVSAARGGWGHLEDLSPATLVDWLVTLDSELSAHLVDPGRVEDFTPSFIAGLTEAPLHRGAPYRDVAAAIETAQARLELLELVRDYRERRRRLGAGDFGDQMVQAARIARRVPQVGAAMRRRFRVVLLDEYQDTSAAQAVMLSGLFSGPDTAHGLGHPVTAVGDPCQGIYGWRGAATSNITDFPRAFPRGDASASRVFSLTTNRRSGPVILDCANEVMARLAEDPAMPRSGGSGQRLHASEGTAPGNVTAGRFDDVDEEMAWLAADVAAHGGPGRWAGIAVLARTNASVGRIHEELTRADVPVEVVGVGNLVSLSPVHEIVATLRLLDDETNNPALAELLSSRRWRIGPGDLAALGAAARQAARDEGPASGQEAPGHGQAVIPGDERSTAGHEAPGPGQEDSGPGEGARPGPVDELTKEPLCLLDMLDEEIPGLSAEGAARLHRFAEEFARLRRGLGEPLVDLVQRICLLSGVDAELEGDPVFHRQGRRDQLRRFLDVVVEFSDTDPTAGLSAFLAHLDLQIEHENGIEQAVVSASDSVKLLTVHRAKGLEWDRVYLPWLVDGVFPDARARNWVTSARLLPGPLRGDAGSLPALSELSHEGLGSHTEALRQATGFAEDRLAYVAMTRARRELVATSHVWEPRRSRPREPSPYYLILAGRAQEIVAEPGPVADENPLGAGERRADWPGDEDPERRLDALAALVTDHAGGQPAGAPAAGAPELSSDEPLDLDEQATVGRWEREAELLLAQAERRLDGAGAVTVPDSLSATALLQSQRDPEAFLADLVRPMPRRVGTGASVGTRFHEWLEARFRRPMAQLLDADDEQQPEPSDEGAAARARLERLKECFEAGPYARSEPCAVEEPFVLMIGGQQIRGRIDAVFPLDDTDHDFRVVDWKTFDSPGDALQLALYRVAWSDISGVSPERIDAVFHHVWSGSDERPPGLLDRAGLEKMIARLHAVPAGPARTMH